MGWANDEQALLRRANRLEMTMPWKLVNCESFGGGESQSTHRFGTFFVSASASTPRKRWPKWRRTKGWIAALRMRWSPLLYLTFFGSFQMLMMIFRSLLLVLLGWWDVYERCLSFNGQVVQCCTSHLSHSNSSFVLARCTSLNVVDVVFFSIVYLLQKNHLARFVFVWLFHLAPPRCFARLLLDARAQLWQYSRVNSIYTVLRTLSMAICR